MKSVMTLAISVLFLVTANAWAVEGEDTSGRRGRTKVGRNTDGSTDGASDCRHRCGALAEEAFHLCIKNGGGHDECIAAALPWVDPCRSWIPGFIDTLPGQQGFHFGSSRDSNVPHGGAGRGTPAITEISRSNGGPCPQGLLILLLRKRHHAGRDGVLTVRETYTRNPRFLRRAALPAPTKLKLS